MVVFGAGASYDSSADHEAPSKPEQIEGYITRKDSSGFHPTAIRPPLASQLFELRSMFAEVAQQLPKIQIPIDELRNLPSNISVEQKLEKMNERSLSYDEGRRQLVSIRFYLQWIISKCQAQWNNAIFTHTNYRALLGQIDRQRKGDPVCLVTFNYDTLLEEAFGSLDMEFEIFDDYIRRDFKIIKLHGSVNWVREPTKPIENRKTNHVEVANDALKVAERMELSNIYRLIPEAERQQHIFSYMGDPNRGPSQVVFPAIAIPLQKKVQYECPKEHIRALEECIPKTDNLLIIGWKAGEQDFLDLLSKTLQKGVPKKIVSRNRDSADQIQHTLTSAGIDGAHWLLSEGGFTTELRSGRIEDFIAK